jgi:cell division protein FtsL
MPCPICDQKPMNCDCTEAERRMYSENKDLEIEIERLRAERNQWMHNAMAHEQIAAELRVRLMESPPDCL